MEENCQLKWKRPPNFKTGRKDCVPNPELSRPFFTVKTEAHPNIHGNGPETVEFYKKHFGFTARESIALTLGAHSFGRFNPEISLLEYQWAMNQRRTLNNQLFR